MQHPKIPQKCVVGLRIEKQDRHAPSSELPSKSISFFYMSSVFKKGETSLDLIFARL